MHSMIDLCFMCSNKDNKCNILDNTVITQVEYLMPEITIIKLRIPLRICSICEKNLQFFSTFKKECVENSLRLEARINTEAIHKCTKLETNINKNYEDCIKKEVLNESDDLEVKYSMVEEIFIKEDPLPENPYDSEFGDVLQDIVKEESPSQTDTHLQENSCIDIEDKSEKNYDDPDDIVSVNNEINSDENIFVIDASETSNVDSCNEELKSRFKCAKCNKSFPSRFKLERHSRVHSGEKPFKCSICMKTFAHLHHLNTHILIHTGERPHVCDFCQKAFTRKGDLIAHKRIHNNIRPYQCPKCNMTFTQNSVLIAHIRIHTGEKPYQCKLCPYKATKSTNLTKHVRTHTGENPYTCKYCQKAFTTTSSLKRHIAKLHPNQVV